MFESGWMKGGGGSELVRVCLYVSAFKSVSGQRKISNGDMFQSKKCAAKVCHVVSQQMKSKHKEFNRQKL